MSRVNYTMSLNNLAQDLNRYSEEELVKKLAKHHEVDIRFTVKAHCIKGQQSFIELLEYKVVKTKREKRLRGQTRPNKRENGNSGRREPQRPERPEKKTRKAKVRTLQRGPQKKTIVFNRGTDPAAIIGIGESSATTPQEDPRYML